MRWLIVLLVVVLVGGIVTVASHAMGMASAGSAIPLLAEYPVSGSPHYVATESTGRTWFTLPGSNAIGRLVVTSTMDYHVSTFAVPTTDSEPYRLKYAAGKVWFTERTGNKIGRLDPATGQVTEFPVSTSNSQLTGIDVLSGSPDRVWFTEQNGNKLGQLVVTSTTDYAITEYPLPSSYSSAQPEDIYAENNDRIWFTAPGVSRIGNFKPSRWPWSSDAFVLIYAGGGSQPWSIEVDAGGYPWFTERTGNRIGKFFPQTIQDIQWYTLPVSDSDPYGIAISQQHVWFTERARDRVGQLQPNTGLFREFALPSGSTPLGLAADATGCIWIAESGRNKIGAWCPPYFHFIYLPLVMSNS